MKRIQLMFDFRRILQVVTLTTSLISLFTIMYRAKIAKNITIHKLLIAPFVFLLHSTMYYTLVILSQEAIDLDHHLLNTDLSFHAWSVGLSLHAIITVLFLTYAVTKRFQWMNG